MVFSSTSVFAPFGGCRRARRLYRQCFGFSPCIVFAVASIGFPEVAHPHRAVCLRLPNLIGGPRLVVSVLVDVAQLRVGIEYCAP